MRPAVDDRFVVVPAGRCSCANGRPAAEFAGWNLDAELRRIANGWISS